MDFHCQNLPCSPGTSVLPFITSVRYYKPAVATLIAGDEVFGVEAAAGTFYVFADLVSFKSVHQSPCLPCTFASAQSVEDLGKQQGGLSIVRMRNPGAHISAGSPHH